MSKKKKLKILKIIFLIYCSLATMREVYNSLSENFIEISMLDLSIVQSIGPLIFAIFFEIVTVNFIPIIFFIVARFAIVRAEKDSLSEIDFGKYKDYYRDIIANYSPAVLSFIDNFEIDVKKDITATILQLQLKKCIKIENNEIKKIPITDQKLDKNEKYVLEHNIDACDEEEFANLVKEDAISAGLVMSKNQISMRSLKRIGIAFLMIVLGGIALPIIFTSAMKTSKPERFIVLGIIVMLFCNLSIIYLLVYTFKLKNFKYERTEKGEKVNEMLEGLKNYIRDYSKLDEKSANDLIIWEDYLIYSVLFGQNKEIVGEIYNKNESI